ncbi:hypothetical protein BMI91_15680 [Thioclava sediminum]|uniref:Polysaccharide deacetylase n=1 Tax=Thioclava sediminum TaxID=1915319 RepID=A0ABX3MT78_9RHOB|nr:hypothetical protein [Thioclava sediminum]OOY22904.1 hypothetical protein BMI91_15680 [Thioclava sediminum]
MSAQHLSIYLDDWILEQVRAGEHNFFKRLIGAVETADWTVSLHRTGPEARAAAPAREGYALYRMEPPTHARALTCRRTYVGAFWHVETEAERWDWPVAQAAFDADEVDGEAAAQFFFSTRNRLYPGVKPSDEEDLAFIPLQGRLLDHRSFQSVSPVQMIEEVLARHSGPVVATLHPNEDYTAREIEALEAIAARYSRFRFQSGGSPELLRRCRFVATQNSALALEGFFLRKPAILFGLSDFHHIAGSVPREGIEAAFAKLRETPPVARYLYWFLQLQSLNAGRPEFEDRLRARLRHFGWPI